MAVASHIQDINNTDQSLSSPETITETQIMNLNHSEAIGKIVSIVEGPVTAETPDGQTHALKEGDPIHLDETITTAVESYVRMVLNDGTVFQLGPQSRARLDKYAYDPAVVGGEFESTVSIGTFRYISGKISGHNQGQHTLIKTPSAHIGIRGSEIDIQVDEQGSTTVLHLSGLISVTSPYHGGEQIVYEHGTTIHISSESTATMIFNTLTESQIQQINQKWDVFGSSDYVTDPHVSSPKDDNSKLSEPPPESSSPPDTTPTPNSDAGARNPFAPATKDVSVGESIDEPISSHETLREYGQFTGIAKLSWMPSPSEIAITARLGTAIATNGDSDDFITTGLANEFQAQREFVIPERLITNNNTSFVEDELLHLKGEIIQQEENTSDNRPTSDGSPSSTDNLLPTDQNQSDSNQGSLPPIDDSLTPPSSNNQAPITQSDLLFLNDEINAPVSIPVATLLENDQDSDGDSLQVIAVTEFANGTAQLVDETEIIFTPQTPFSQGGFKYLVSDGKATTPGEVIITHNLAPIARDDQLITPDLAPLTISTRQLLANDSDPNADALKIISVSQIGSNGSVAFNQQGDLVFTPHSNFIADGFGEFTYEVSDGHDKSAMASVIITLDKFTPPNPLINYPPIPQNDQIEINQLEPTPITTSQLLANDRDPDNDNLSIISVQNGLNSQVTLNQDSGEIVFTPTPTFNGSEQFTYEISDGYDHQVSATVTITLINLPPVAESDGPFDMAFQEQISLSIQEQLLINDTDPNGDPLTLSRITESVNGTATLDGKGNVIFNRSTDFQGQGGFTYEINDGKGGSTTTQVAITGNLPSPPQLQFDEGKTNKNQPLILPIALLLANDLPQNKLTITAVNNAVHGEVQLDQANNQVVFKPELNFSGQAHFDYMVTDNQGINASTVVNIEVTNRRPIANPDQFDTISNTPLLIAKADLLKNDTDPDGDIDKLTVMSVAAIDQSTVTLNGDNILFMPVKDFEGQAQFSYTITDTSGSLATIPVTVTVERLVSEDHLNTTKNLSITVAAKDLLANDKDPNLTLTTVNPVEPGTVVRDADGNIVFTPAPNFVGEAQFQYSVTDVAGRTDSASVKVTVTNTPPVAQDDTVTMIANSVLTIPITELLANDKDADPGEILTLEIGQTNQGNVELSENGNEILFTPAEDVTGEASLNTP
ncbi:MAG: cadherin-like domain-containing protein [Thioploca sp.]|nr:cadherin-like domain-containing protein [Thioploca sp.]